jgi:type IV pilus assembly protein PilE
VIGRNALTSVERANPRRTRPGMTLIELMVVMTLTGVMAVMAVPSYRRGMEQSRVDQAAATLRTVWAAQRIYRLDNSSYAADLSTLSAAKLIDPSIASTSNPFSYEITAANAAGFTMSAHRSGSQVWGGALSIDETGVVTGSIASSDFTIAPSRVITE